jgi:hypothetical protein
MMHGMNFYTPDGSVMMSRMRKSIKGDGIVGAHPEVGNVTAEIRQPSDSPDHTLALKLLQEIPLVKITGFSSLLGV